MLLNQRVVCCWSRDIRWYFHTLRIPSSHVTKHKKPRNVLPSTTTFITTKRAVTQPLPLSWLYHGTICTKFDFDMIWSRYHQHNNKYKHKNFDFFHFLMEKVENYEKFEKKLKSQYYHKSNLTWRLQSSLGDRYDVFMCYLWLWWYVMHLVVLKVEHKLWKF